MKKPPRFPRGMSAGISVAPAATSFWFPADSLERQTKSGGGFSYRDTRVWLGRTPTDNAEPVGWMDDRHMVTIAGSRSGKGTSAIIPALCEYAGSVICIDPKGENAQRTAARRGSGTSNLRGLHQDVYVLDPYNVSDVEALYQATFDPLEALGADGSQTLEEAGLIAEALVIGSHERDPHWDESAKAIIEALILHVVSHHRHETDKSLARVRVLVRDGDKEALQALKDEAKENNDEQVLQSLKRYSAFDALLLEMKENPAFEGIISGAASGLKDLGERERGSVLSTARRNLKFLDAPEMQACLRTSDHALKIEDLRRNKHGVSVYIVLPSRLMEMHSRWMRLILNLTISRLERDTAPAAKSDLPVLAILDEFPTLRHLPALETAVAYMAGFGLKLWAILQDLSQLKRHYPNSWETFLGNAGMLQFFGNSDPTTLEYIAKRLGEIEVIRETSTLNKNEATTISDISDFEKLQSTAGGQGLDKFLGSFRLENSTESTSKSFSEATSTNQVLQKTDLMTPDEIRRYFSRASGLQIVTLADFRPLFLRRTPYFEDPFFAGKYVQTEGETTTLADPHTRRSIASSRDS